jgi:hypothetical protein
LFERHDEKKNGNVKAHSEKAYHIALNTLLFVCIFFLVSILFRFFFGGRYAWLKAKQFWAHKKTEKAEK